MNTSSLSKLCFPLLFVSCALATATAAASVVDFEDLTPGTAYTGHGGGHYWNGSDGTGGFTSRGTHFSNTYSSDPQFGGYWSGWSCSNTTDTVTGGHLNQYSANTGAGHSDPGANYGVYYEPWSVSPTVSLAPGSVAIGVWITNTTYATLSMLNGDSFAKRFGGESGDDADWFLLSISGTNSLGQTNTVDFYLADYRFTDNSRDYVVDAWTWVDLWSLGDARELAFDLSSSDNDPLWGMNTPAYFALDDLTVVPEPGTFAMLGTGGICCLAGLFVRRRSRPLPHGLREASVNSQGQGRRAATHAAPGGGARS